MKTEKEFVPYQQALELKELGFDEPCFDFYDNNQELFYNHENKEKIHVGDGVNAPLYQQAFRWFREEYALDSYIRPNLVYDVPKTYQYNINDNIDDVWYNTYEEAELACLIKLIEIVKEQKL
jgi:hypothetical protein